MGNSTEYLPVCKNTTCFSTWLVLNQHGNYRASYCTKKELLFTEKVFKSGKDTVSFKPIRIWEPRTRLPSKLTWFCLFHTHCLSILWSVPTRILTVRQHSHEHALPLFLKESLFHRFSPRGIHPPDSANHGVTRESISHSVCAGRDIYLLALRYDTHAAYLQEWSRFNQNFKICQMSGNVFTERAKWFKGICNYCSLCKWEF